jgi:autotransporter-associated beta strand protein
MADGVKFTNRIKEDKYVCLGSRCVVFSAQFTLRFRFHGLITCALILWLLSGVASAAVVTWDGGGVDNTWANNTGSGGGAKNPNWGPPEKAPTTGDDLEFGGVTRLTPDNNISNLSVNSLTFLAGAGQFILGGLKLDFGVGNTGITNNSTNLQTINMALGLNATTTITGASGADIVIGGVVSGTNTGITKTGANTLTLTAANTYTGATNVNVGTLIVNGSIASSSLTTVASGATIGGSGTVGALTVSSGGFINPGATGGTGILSTGNYTQAGTYNVGIASTVPGTGHDQINVTGTVNITSGSLTTSFSGTGYAAGNLIFILLNDGADAITGTYNGLAQNATVTSHDGFNWQISYTANSSLGTFTGGNDIALRAIPEPSAVLLGSLGTVFLLLRRRRTA